MQPELRVYLREECLINPDPETAGLAIPLLGLFAPKLIEMGIGGIATLLKKAGADHTTNVTSGEFTHFYTADDKQALQVNEKIGCILAVWGVFSDEDERPTPARDTAVKKLEEVGLVPLNADIEIIFEAAIRQTADQTAFFLDAKHFSVRNFIREGGKSERGFVVTLNITIPGATADGQSIALGHIDFGQLSRGADLVPDGRLVDGFPRFRSNLMPWKQISDESKSAYDADVAAGQAAGKSYMPVTFNLTISETAAGSPFLAQLGELLEGAKADAAAEISKLILPEDRAKAAAARAEAAEKLYNDELDAELAVRGAKKDYDAGAAEDKPVLRVKLEKAIRQLNRATKLREAAGLPARPPVPES